jgi:hypothetical protein
VYEEAYRMVLIPTDESDNDTYIYTGGLVVKLILKAEYLYALSSNLRWKLEHLRERKSC